VVTYRTVVTAFEALVHQESGAQADAIPGRACERSVRADNALRPARSVHGNRRRSGRNRRTFEALKGGWWLGLVAQGLARRVLTSQPARLRAECLELAGESRGACSPGTRPNFTGHTRTGFRCPLTPNPNDISVAIIGAELRDVTHPLLLLDTTSAMLELQGRASESRSMFRADLSDNRTPDRRPLRERTLHPVITQRCAGYGGCRGAHRWVVHRTSDSAKSVVFVSAANAAATSTKYCSNPVGSFPVNGISRLTRKSWSARIRERTLPCKTGISMTAAAEIGSAGKETL
jgi:hypothetical protein